jgi:hypothetical protein
VTQAHWKEIHLSGRIFTPRSGGGQPRAVKSFLKMSERRLLLGEDVLKVVTRKFFKIGNSTLKYFSIFTSK